MPRHEFRALMLSVPRTDRANPSLPAQVAAALPTLCAQNAQATLGNRVRLVTLGGSLLNLGLNWYMVLTDCVMLAFAPHSGLAQATVNELVAKAGTSGVALPWGDETAKLQALSRQIPTALRNHLY